MLFIWPNKKHTFSQTGFQTYQIFQNSYSFLGVTMDDNAKRVIAKAMKDYVVEWDVQMWGCQIFNNLVVTG